MKCIGGNWNPIGSSELFSGTTGAFTTSAMDPNSGTIYALYYNVNGKLTVMKNVNSNSSNWITVGGEFGSASGNQNIAVDPTDGTPYVIYQDKFQNGSKACVVKFNGNNWVSVGTPDFSAGAIFQSDIAIYNGTPYVAYSDGGNSNRATVMKFNGGNWVNVGSQGFSAGTAAQVALSIDNCGIPYVGYQDGGNGSRSTVMKFDGTGWIPVGSPGFSPSAISQYSVGLTTDDSNNIYISFVGSGGVTVMKYAGTVSNSGNPSLSISASQESICFGDQVAFTAVPINGGASPVYQWKKNGNNVGTNSASYTDNNLVDNDVITCMLTSNTTCASPSSVVSNAVTISVNPRSYAGTVTAVKDTVCSGTPVTLNVSGSSGGTIQWQSSISPISFSDIPGANGSSYLSPSLSQTTFFRVRVGTGNCADTSSLYRVIVVAAPVAVYASETFGLTVNFNSDGSMGATIYEWNFGDNTSSYLSSPSHTYAVPGVYHVCLTVLNGSNCSYISCREIQVGTVTGITTTITPSRLWKIQPIPFDDHFFIYSGENSSSVKCVELYNILGKSLIHSDYEGKTQYPLKVNIPQSVNDGIYFLRIKSSGGKDYTQLITRKQGK